MATSPRDCPRDCQRDWQRGCMTGCVTGSGGGVQTMVTKIVDLLHDRSTKSAGQKEVSVLPFVLLWHLVDFLVAKVSWGARRRGTSHPHSIHLRAWQRDCVRWRQARVTVLVTVRVTGSVTGCMTGCVTGSGRGVRTRVAKIVNLLHDRSTKSAGQTEVSVLPFVLCGTWSISW